MNDPFAAIAKPATAAPPAPPSGDDPFAAIAKPSPGLGALVSQGESEVEKNANRMSPGLGGGIDPELGRIAGGAVKSAGNLVGNVLDLTNRFNKTVQPGVVEQHPNAVKHIQDAADWLRSGSQPDGFWENMGAVGEQVLEYLGTDGLLKLVGGGAAVAAGAKTATGAVKATEQLDRAKQVAQTIASNPKIAGLLAVGLKASKDAAMIGGQTYLHTEDPTQAAEAAATGGILRGAGEGVSAAGRWVQKVRPTSITIGGVNIPVLASQLNEAGAPLERGAAEAPAIAEQQQQGAQGVIRNSAQNAAQTALERVNKTRPVQQATGDAARLLPAGEGAEPFTFTLEGTPTQETPTGQIAHPAGKVTQPAAFPPKYTTASGPEPIEGGVGTTSADVSTATPPEARAESVTGGGNLTTTSPETATSWLRQLEDVEQSSTFKNLPAAQQNAITSQREQLEQQLGLYHASPYAQRFAPVDVQGAVDHVRTFGDAAEQVRNVAKPVYAKIDQVSGGEFDKWNKAAKQARRIMQSSTSVDAYDAAEAKYHEANQEIDNLLTRYAGDVNRGDYQAAKVAWRDSARLDELHAVFERMMNGITADESEQGLNRVMTGRTRQLQNYLDKGDNQQQIEQLIGKDGVTNLKKLTQLMSKPNSTRSTVDVLKNVWTEIGRHARVGGTGGAIGGTIAHYMGAPWYEGMMAGAAATEGVRAVMRSAMTNPRVGQLVDYAVEHGASPSVYAPLIARTIAVPFESQNEGDEQ